MDVGNIWSKHWYELAHKRRLIGCLFQFYRKNFRARAVSSFLKSYFPANGVFLECGSGSSQTSIKIKEKPGDFFIALDISKPALDEAKKIPIIDSLIRGDIFSIPIQDNSIDGVWNLGVFEHYSKEDMEQIISEVHRILKPNGVVVVFWPSEIALDKYIFNFIEFFAHFFNKDFHFFPPEPNRLSSKQAGIDFMEENGFKGTKVFFPLMDFFTQYVVVTYKDERS